MQDRLPNITIKPDVPPDQFLDRIRAVALELGEYDAQPGPPVPGLPSANRLVIIPLLITQHRGLTGVLTAAATAEGRVKVAPIAVRWNPDPPTYEVYVATAKDLFVPLIRHYNHTYHSNRRLHIPTRDATQPYLPNMAQTLFADFTTQAHKSTLRRADWQSLYGFIRHCHARRVHATRDDIHRLLVTAGFSLEHAAEIADVYEHGRGILQQSIALKREGKP